MSDTKRIGKNIRVLRKAYGETQEALGVVLNVEKNTISNYENGREPNREILAAIAKYYMVSVEELVSCDLSEIGKITVDNNVFFVTLI